MTKTTRKEKEVLTYQQYANMSFEELLKALKAMLAQAGRMIVWFDKSERVNLLPALQAMHDKVAQPGRRIPDPQKPNWEDVCRMLGITPNLVKQWKHLTQTDTDIRHLLGEQPPQPKRSTAATQAEAVKHLQMLVTAVLNGDEERAEALAAALAERYEF
jgi:hypothetical protein